MPENAGPVEWIGPDHPLYDISELIHCVRMPEEANLKNPAPVVVMVHGWSGDEASMWLFKQVVPKNVAIVTPRAPIELSDERYIWFKFDDSRAEPAADSVQESLARFKRFITGLPDMYAIDPDRLLLLGFSQGAAISNSLALTHPKLTVGVASLSGFIPKMLDLPQDERLADLPVFIAHGTNDEIVPVDKARRARDIYNDLGANVTYDEFSTGHKVDVKAMRALKKWVKGLIQPDGR
jgi:phospholipase/carboxylesterase